MSGKKRLDRSSERLGARRRKSRRRALLWFFVLLALVSAALVYALWQPTLRIVDVEVYGTTLPVKELVQESLNGSYAGLAPRNSAFLIPETQIRTRILAQYPTIAAVSVFRNGFTGLTIKATDRAPIARWCGDGQTTPEGTCYVFDASGVVYDAIASTTETIHPFVLLAPLTEPSSDPRGNRILHATLLPATFDLARAIGMLGSPVERIVIQEDEVSEYLYNGTRITYVLGSEQQAYAALMSAKDQVNLSSGLEYVDLRFEGRIYIKRKVDSAEETVNSQ